MRKWSITVRLWDVGQNHESHGKIVRLGRSVFISIFFIPSWHMLFDLWFHWHCFHCSFFVYTYDSIVWWIFSLIIFIIICRSFKSILNFNCIKIFYVCITKKLAPIVFDCSFGRRFILTFHWTYFFSNIMIVPFNWMVLNSPVFHISWHYFSICYLSKPNQSVCACLKDLYESIVCHCVCYYLEITSLGIVLQSFTIFICDMIKYQPCASGFPISCFILLILPYQ